MKQRYVDQLVQKLQFEEQRKVEAAKARKEQEAPRFKRLKSSGRSTSHNFGNAEKLAPSRRCCVCRHTFSVPQLISLNT